MNSVHQLRGEIAVVGWSCRLPGANSIDELWSLLLEGRCAITQMPGDRFPLENYGHPRKQERGKSYTWAAGVLDDIWGFDPGVFGISPREAAQIDPQQRLLLQLTWEALEDAGIRPSSVANSDIGVYVGASQADYGDAFFHDPAITDTHSATGTALAILANRISHVYGLHGPSLTVDTACSSSLVALHQAMEALRSGRIDTAIVGGCNLLAGPSAWVGFSQAGMLSEKGLCQAFAAGADGFVRAEGAVVLILRNAAVAHAQRNPIHGLVLASDVNSDGRTNGIAMPSLEAQEALLQRLYARNRIDVDRLAFVEAHGTGTAVGDPIEAAALGRIIGRNRDAVLPIGSIKTNIGHLEPGSGLAGVVKAILSLNHGILPASLHFKDPNPAIDFNALNVRVCTQPLLLAKSAGQCAGVNSFGFGGTNAHAVVAAGQKPPLSAAEPPSGAGLFALSANSETSLLALARHYAERVPQLSDRETAALASAIVHRREQLPNRIVISSAKSQDVAHGLNALIAGKPHPALTAGTALGAEMPVAFVYSGNGSQWVGMGLAAYRRNADFRARFDEADGYFSQMAGWSLKEALSSDTLPERLPLTSIAQPLIFAIQVASTAALRAGGLRPSAVLGHSVGEIAAAEAAGILDLRTATKVIHCRSMQQELTHKLGGMAAVFASAEALQPIVEGIHGLEIAAINSPRTVTVAGPVEAMTRFKQVASERDIAIVDLNLDYPFHTRLMAAVEPGLRADLRDIRVSDADVPFVSSVTGACMPGSRLDGHYWWRNVREPVQFRAAVRATAELGARYFIEVGPRPTLLKHIADSLRGEVNGFATLSVLDRSDDDVDPFDRVRAKALVSGARIDTESVFGPDPGPGIELPLYPWDQKPYRLQPTPEAKEGSAERHAFAGARDAPEAPVWRSVIDTALHPVLADHTVRGQAIFPGTAFLEMALAVARQWLRAEAVIVSEFEILAPLDLTNGESRDVMTRVSPGSNTIEILSRARLSRGGWLLNCRGKIQIGNAAYKPHIPAISGGEVIDGAQLYEIAADHGLRYGPAFRLAERVVIHDDKWIDVYLATSTEGSAFLLDPVRTDCCGHGLLALLPRLRAGERGVTYVPVRFEEAAVYRPHVAPQRALIEVVSRSDHALVSNCYLLGAQEEVVAVLRGVRGQAIPTRRASVLDMVAFAELPWLIDGAISGRLGFPATAGDVIAAAGEMGITSDSAAAMTDAGALMEGWAMAAACEIASSLATRGALDIDALVKTGRLAEHARPWLANILINLEAAGLAKRDEGAWTLVADEALPRSAEVVRALAAEHQGHAGELLMAAALSGFAKRVADDKAVTAETENALGKATLDFYQSADPARRDWSETLFRVLAANEQFWPAGRALRVLEIGFSPLAQSLLSSRYAQSLALAVFEPDRRRFESADLALANTQARLIDADRARELGNFDLIVSAGGLHRLPADLTLADVCKMLAPGGMLLGVEPRRSLFKDLTLGLDPGWFKLDRSGRGVSPLRTSAHWPSDLTKAGFRNSRAAPVRCGVSGGCLIVAEASQADAVERAATKSVVLVGNTQTPLSAQLEAALAASGAAVWTSADASEDAPACDEAVFLPDDGHETPGAAEAVSRRCLALTAFASKMQGRTTKLWLIFRGALAAGASPIVPVETAAWAFSRTLANEFPKLDVRRIDIAPGVSPDLAAAEIRKVFTSGTAETELQVAADAVRAVRVVPLRHAEAVPITECVAASLRRRGAGGQRVGWEPIERKQPEADEVEIEVEAAGLNFRDLMLSLGVLPDDIFENGFSGANLGLEFAGKVLRIGAGVKDLRVGDRVLGFAGSSFSTHLTVKAAQALKLPPGLSSEAAATIPVAFFTAYYSLIVQARLSRREWVLIHGGAGGVGLAAIKIAQSRGARIIASAGSQAKRDLLRALGVRHVVDSRSTTFVDDVRRITGEGVDVVLNSLAGEAMERSIGCLRPFGRFVELGKRDYVGNTHVGLRPFRQNLSYFGVDIDQVMNGRGGLGTRTFARIMKHFEKGTLLPLPYTVFDASEVNEAFHVMQKAIHVGKIVIRPNVNGGARPQGKAFEVSATGTHVITGAFGGFGLETAKWLADKGARYIAMIGRRGVSSPEAQAAVDALRRRGVEVVTEACDVGDQAEVKSLFDRLRQTMPPVAGIMHAAMVLDDALLTDLDAERFARVLAPKVMGADNLDRVVGGQPLDYFVMFSSISTLIGNPGQGNYVAANAYMEGLARRRRQRGLAALAVGWGPIADVGVVARNARLRGVTEKITGGAGLLAREALDLMAQAIRQSSGGVESGVITIAPPDASFSSSRLSVLRSPTYTALTRHAKARDAAAESIDLHALAASNGLEAARAKVIDVVSAQIAQVLHLGKDDIGAARPLGEIGLDSLMAVELAMNLETAFHIQIPLQGSAGAMTVSDIADEVVAQLGLEPDDDSATVRTLVKQHGVRSDELDKGVLDGVDNFAFGRDAAAKRLLS